jgi:thymidylate kinase
MFYGVCPGAGKTTLSAWLNQRLVDNGCDVIWIEEHDVLHLEVFGEVVRAFTEGTSDYVTPLLRAAQKLVALHANDQSIIITDSIFPSITWLFAAGLGRHEIQSFSDQIADNLSALNPLVIFLNGDVRELLKRAIQQRGDEWLKGLVTTINSYNYAPIRPVVGMEEIAVFFEALQQLQIGILSAWKHSVLRLEVTTSSLRDLQLQIIGYLGRDD